VTSDPTPGPQSSTAPRFVPIPVWDSVKAGFSAVYGDLNSFFMAARVWVIVLAILDAVVLSAGHAINAQSVSGLAFVVGVVRVIATAAFLVAWHRRVLLNAAIDARGPLKLGRREWRFVGYELVPAVLAAVVVAVSLALPMSSITVAVGAIAVLVVSVRWFLFAPLAALDIPGNLLAHSWKLTRGNGVRLFGGVFLVGLLVIIPFALLDALYFAFAGENVSSNFILNLVYSVAAETLNFAVLAWAAGFLCHSFAAIMGRSLPLDPKDTGIFPAVPAANP